MNACARAAGADSITAAEIAAAPNFEIILIILPRTGREIGRTEARGQPVKATKPVAPNERLIARALAMDGTCTGEHGVGQGKMGYMVTEHGQPAIEAMQMVKRAFDPAGIMNPGKIVDFA